jgi:photosystem II stability/assembly factor-like uncharacterized protein
LPEFACPYSGINSKEAILKHSRLILALSCAILLVTGAWAQSRVALVVIASEGPAQVILSGRLVGVANPRLTTQVAPGNYDLLVRKPGLPEFRQQITVGSGGLTVNAPLGGASIQPAPQPIQPAPQPIQPIQPAPQPIQPIQPAPLPIQPIQPAPQPQQQSQTLQQPQTAQPTPQAIQPAPQAVQPAPQAVQSAPAANERGIPVTFIWHAADTADIYINGVPIKTFSPDYKTRGDEASAQPFTQSGFIKHGDIITVGTRRGGSFGFMMVVVDSTGAVLLKTDETWQWYDGSSDPRWYEPAAFNMAAKKGPVRINPSPWGNQNGMVSRYGSALRAIFTPAPADTMTNLYYQVNMPGIAGVEAPGVQPASPAPGSAPATVSYEYQFVPLSGLSNLRAAVRGPDRFIVAGNGAVPYTSFDGRAWTTGTKVPVLHVTDLAWGNGLYVATGDNGGLATSSDGLNWTARSSGTSRHLASAMWTGSQYIVTGQGGTLLTSRDGVTWSSVTSGVSSHLMGIAQDRQGGTIAIVTIDGTILYSRNNGQSWERASVGLGSGTIHCITAGPAGFVTAASSADGRVFFSPDGASWSVVHQGDGKAGYGAAFWDGANFIVSGLGHVLVSPDGRSWRRVEVPQNKPAGKSATGNGLLVTVSADGTGILLSSTAAMAASPAGASSAGAAPSRPVQAATPATPAQPGVAPATPASPARPTTPAASTTRGPSAKGWKALGPIKSYQGTPGWGISFLVEYKDGTLAVASDGSKHIMWSDDQGKTWHERSPAEASGGYAKGLSLAPDGSLYFPVLYAGLFRTTDKGRTWTKIDQVSKVFSHFFIASSGTLFATRDVSSNNNLYRSTDGGRTWTVSHPYYPGNTISEAADGSLYAYFWDGKGIHRSTDDGRTWVKTPMQTVFSDMSIVFGNGEIYIHSLDFLSPRMSATTYRYSTGNGTNWESLKIQFKNLAVDKAGDLYGIEMRSVGDEYFSTHLVRSIDGGRSFVPFENGYNDKEEPYRMFQGNYSGKIYVSTGSLFVLE